ncbi:hypothetical protein Dimus_036707 [Dionaea muscipula]
MVPTPWRNRWPHMGSAGRECRCSREGREFAIDVLAARHASALTAPAAHPHGGLLPASSHCSQQCRWPRRRLAARRNGAHAMEESPPHMGSAGRECRCSREGREFAIDVLAARHASALTARKRGKLFANLNASLLAECKATARLKMAARC